MIVRAVVVVAAMAMTMAMTAPRVATGRKQQ
jgi:hypothetical protein